MDGVSVAASILAIAGAGIKISVDLITFATRVDTASDRITAVGNDVSVTAGVLQQLGELLQEKPSRNEGTLFSEGGLRTTQTSADICGKVFKDLEKAVVAASGQLRSNVRRPFGRVKLSNLEKVKWPFLQAHIDDLRTDLREAKGTLMLMLQVVTLATSRKLLINRLVFSIPSDPKISDVKYRGSRSEHDKVDAIVALKELAITSEGRDRVIHSQPSDKSQTTTKSNLERPCENNPNRTGHENIGPALTSTSMADPATSYRNIWNIPPLDRRGMHQGLIQASPAPDLGNPRPGPTRTESDRHSTDPDALPSCPSAAKMKYWLYHLRPSVQDKFYTIELHWGVSSEAQEPEPILAPAINIATEALEEPERYQIKNTILSQPGLYINKLERIFVDIPVRNFVLKRIPGLRIFALQYPQPLPGIETILNTPSSLFDFVKCSSYSPMPQRQEVLQNTQFGALQSGAGVVPRQGAAAGIPSPLPPQNSLQLPEYEDEFCPYKRRKLEMPQTPSTFRASSFSPYAALSSQPRSLHDENQQSLSLPQSVEELLQKYTTLYDNNKLDGKVAKP